MGSLIARSETVLLFALGLLLVEESFAVYIDRVLSLLIAFSGAFVTAILPYIVKRAAPVKASLQCFSLVFLTRVAVAVVPALILPPPLLLTTVYSIVLMICIVYVIDRRLPAKSIGFHYPNLRLQVFAGSALGVAMGFIEFAILYSDMKKYLLFQEFSTANFIYTTIIMFLFVAFGEEFLFRGLAQSSLQEEISSPVATMLIVSSTFAIMHLGYVTSLMKVLEIIYVFGAATIIGYAFMKTKSLVLPLVAHGIANTILFGILPYLI